jgi:uncharacterized iron-regulated membrane protein
MHTDSDNEQTNGRRGSMIGAGIAIGVGFGVALGLSFGNLALGIAIGAAIGVSIGVALEERGPAGPLGAGDRAPSQRALLILLVALGLVLALVVFAVVLMLSFGG